MRRRSLFTLTTAVTLAAAAGVAMAARPATKPIVQELPWITGTPVEGKALTAGNGEWGGTRPLTFTYQWRECNAAGAECVDVAGATSRTLTLAASSIGKRIRVQVTATNRDGATSAVSGATAVVRAKPAAPPPPPPPPPGPAGQIKLADGKVSIPVTSVPTTERLVVTGVTFSPNPVRSRGPITARFRVTDTRGYVVRDALVYMTGVPFGRITQAPEAATSQEGYASFQVVPTPRLQLVNGAALVVFVRARKAGDPLLAGISSRRLVQVRLGSP
jgi:hypothetical protein